VVRSSMPKKPSIEEKIQHAYWIMQGVNFRVSDSPMWAAERSPLSGASADEIASLIVDMQFHGI